MNLTFTLITAALIAQTTGSGQGQSPLPNDSLVRPLGSSHPFEWVGRPPFPLAEARVLKVTNTGGEGPGSLRAALRESGPRLIVFEVGGVIDLGGKSLEIKNPQAFVAGETAPAPGITLIRGGLSIEAADVVVRHLAVRPGDRGPGGTTEWLPDGIRVARGARPVHHVLVENCSATWAVDENASVSGPADTRPAAGADATAHDVVFRNNLIGEALFHSTHPKGPHSMGLLVHDGIGGVRIEGNLFASNNERNPRLKGGVVAAVTGNVLYNWGSAAIGVGRRGNREILDGAQAVVTGNVAIPGPDTKSRVLIRAVDPGASVRAGSNLASAAGGKPLSVIGPGIEPLASTPPGLEPGPAQSASETIASVLSHVGARPAERDPIDQRIVASVITGTGRIIDSQEAVGGYPTRTATTRTLTVPDGREARLAWLGAFMTRLATAPDLDFRPLLSRLGIPR